MIKKLFLILLFVAFTFSEVFRIETSFGFGIKALDLFVILGSGIWFTMLLLQKKITFDTPIKLFLCFIGVGLISLLINPLHLTLLQLGVSSIYLLRFLSFGLFFFSLRTDADKAFLQKGLLMSGVSIVILGFLQYFLYSSLRNRFYLGWDEHLHRLFTVFFDPNFAGMFFVLLLLYLWHGLFHKIYTQKVLYPLIALTSLALLLTYSRSSYVCLGIGITILFLIEKKKRELRLFFVGIGLLFLLLFPTFATNNTYLFRVASSLSRVNSYVEGWNIAKDHLVLGVGFNTYRYSVEKSGYHHPSDIAYNHSEAGNDNSFLFVLGTTGIVGLLIYLCFLYSLMKTYAVGNAKSIVVASLCVMIVGSFFNNVLFYTPLLFWMFITFIATNEDE
jgi:O-antigen ligase